MKCYKMFSITLKTLLVILMLSLVNCSEPYTYKANRSMIELSEDDPFQIVLEGDTASDFYWQLISNNTYVKLEKPVSVTTNANKTIYTFDFKTISDGNEKIEIIYTNGEAIENTFQLDVVIGTIGLITSEL